MGEVGLLIFLVLFVAMFILFILLLTQVAQNKGRSPVNWLLIALIISPLLALILVAILPPADGQGPVHRGCRMTVATKGIVQPTRSGGGELMGKTKQGKPS